MRPPDFWSARGGASHALSLALAPIGWLHGASVAFKARNARPHRARAKVICIGNLTAGGTGKTPVAIAFARALQARGARPVILSRGYGGRARGPIAVDREKDTAAGVGDEALMAAASVPVIVSRDRAAGAALADAEHFDVIVMDDGHQNFALMKDLSVVVIDSENPFGNGRMIPAGPLREPVAQGLARADAVVLSGDGTPSLPFIGPILRAHMKPAPNVDIRGKKIVAFAGIGRPEKFFASLAALGAEVTGTMPFPDHHAYSASDIARLKARARDAMLMTTEKDYVRLTPAEREGIACLPVEVVFDDRESFDELLDRITKPAIAP